MKRSRAVAVEARVPNRPTQSERSRKPADRPSFLLDEARWQAFQNVLERPLIAKPRLARLLTEKSVLE